MSILNKNLLADSFPDLFPALNKADKDSCVKREYAKDTHLISELLKAGHEKQPPIKENEVSKIYRAEDLKQKFRVFIADFKNTGVVYIVGYDVHFHYDCWGNGVISGIKIAVNKGLINDCERLANLLQSDKELEALLILEAAKTDYSLRVLIEDRAAIRHDAGLSGSVFLAVLSDIYPETKRREFQPDRLMSWEQELRLIGI